VCYKCREKGQLVDACPNATASSGSDLHRSDRSPRPFRPVLAHAATLQGSKARKIYSLRRRLRSKHEQEITRWCDQQGQEPHLYACPQKGRMGKDCPNGNFPKLNLVHYDVH
jgi:hypothetical protein